MTARRTWLILNGSSLALCLLLVLILSSHAQSTTAIEAPLDGNKIDLKVLYAGNKSSPRATDFKNFLSGYFSKVLVIALPSLTKHLAEEHDVVIIDWTSIYPARGPSGKIDSDGDIAMPPTPGLPEDYAHPTVLIGAAGGHAVRDLRLKIDWL
jgi:hypothetical protein